MRASRRVPSHSSVPSSRTEIVYAGKPPCTRTCTTAVFGTRARPPVSTFGCALSRAVPRVYAISSGPLKNRTVTPNPASGIVVRISTEASSDTCPANEISISLTAMFRPRSLLGSL